jgi:hypothetical protein
VFWLRNWIIVRELFSFDARKDPEFTHKEKVGEERRMRRRMKGEGDMASPPSILGDPHHCYCLLPNNVIKLLLFTLLLSFTLVSYYSSII